MQTNSYIFGFFFLLTCLSAGAQENLVFRGTLENNINFFRRDSLIGAAGIPQYGDNDIGGELWLELNTAYKGWQAGIRLDAFRNSNLLNPNDAYTANGLGRFYLSKDFGKASFYVGYLYDQIGSGIIFRSYETRPQLIDNALLGGKASYAFTDDLILTGYYGRQKRQFDFYDSDIRGLNLESYFETGSDGAWTLSPGIGYINRALSEENMDNIVNVLRTYLEEDRVIPRYNTYLFTAYNTLGYKSLQWYVEVAYKTPELFFDPHAIRTEITGRKAFGKYVKRHGTVYYSSISLALKNLGITVEGKRTGNFNFRANPLARQNDGLISFIPPMNRQSTYRLLSRYSPATQDLSEMAWQLDIQHKLNRKWSWHLNLSDIYTLDEVQLYKELYLSASYRHSRKLQLKSGVQIMTYNQEIYEVKPGNPMVETVVPFADLTWLFKKRKSLRTEIQYMFTEEDYGSWFFAQVELAFAKGWQLELSGMYNTQPGPASPENPDTGEKEKILYPTFGFTYTYQSKRFSLRYVKQVEGVICTGGICRLEPAFSGIRLNTNVQF